jgi:hypothetical protein
MPAQTRRRRLLLAAIAGAAAVFAATYFGVVRQEHERVFGAVRGARRDDPPDDRPIGYPPYPQWLA